MAHVAFDTLKFVQTLEASGMPEKQAIALSEAHKQVLHEALDHSLATKADITRLEKTTKMDMTKLEKSIVRIETEIKLLKWMMGIVIGGLLALIIKTFF